MMKILLVKLGSIGDIVHALPVLSALKKAHPDAAVDWMVERRFRPLLAGHPLLRRLVDVDTLGWRRSLGSPATWAGARRALRLLRSENYDVVFDLQGLVKSSLLARLARAKRRVGFGSGSRERAAQYLLSESMAPPADVTHVVRRNLYLLRALGIEVTDGDVPIWSSGNDEELNKTLGSLGVDRYVLLNPGAGWKTKRWGVDRFGRLARELAEDTGAIPLVLWGPDEKELASAVVASSEGAARLAPETDLPGLVSLLRSAELVVGGDTGPVHIAAGLGVPVVGLYGPSNPKTHGPYGRRVRTVWMASECSPCHKRQCLGYDMQCLETMSVEQVMTAVESVLSP